MSFIADLQNAGYTVDEANANADGGAVYHVSGEGIDTYIRSTDTDVIASLISAANNPSPNPQPQDQTLEQELAPVFDAISADPALSPTSKHALAQAVQILEEH